MPRTTPEVESSPESYKRGAEGAFMTDEHGSEGGTGTVESSLTHAIEEEIHTAIGKVAVNGSLSVAMCKILCDSMLKYVEQAHAIGFQEGMDKGANSAVEFIQERAGELDSATVLFHTVPPEIFEMARTAHKNTEV